MTQKSSNNISDKSSLDSNLGSNLGSNISLGKAIKQKLVLHKMHAYLDNNDLAHYQLSLAEPNNNLANSESDIKIPVAQAADNKDISQNKSQNKNNYIELNSYIGQVINLTFTNKITCQGCGNNIKKCYQPGFCFLCTRRLACCDMCMVKPELCHYAAGTCRQPQWGEQYCMKHHIIYLANSSGLKVGITRDINIPNRWIDQGATQALPVLRVTNRLDSGKCEIVLAKYIADKTNWRKMLSGEAEPLDLKDKWHSLMQEAKGPLNELIKQNIAVESCPNAEIINIKYPVTQYLPKISSLNFDKQAHICGKLLGIKGQYLILDSGVLNIRKFSGYEVLFQQFPASSY